MQPWQKPVVMSNFEVVSPLIDTFICISTWKLRMKLSSCDRTPLFSSNLHARSRSTESKAQMRSVKIRCKSFLCSLHFSCSCLKTNIISNVDRPKRNPFWVSGRSFSIRGFRRLSTTLARTFPATESRIIPLQFAQAKGHFFAFLKNTFTFPDTLNELMETP